MATRKGRTPASGGGPKQYGSSTQSCPLRNKGKGKIEVLVNDPQKKGVFGVKVEAKDKTGAIKNGTTDGSGFATMTDLAVGPCTLTLTLDEKERQTYHDPLPETATAEVRDGGGFHVFNLKPIVKTIRPKIFFDLDSVMLDPVKKSSEPVWVDAHLDQDTPQIEFAGDGKLTRSGGIKVYTDSGCSSELAFSGDVATVPAAQLKDPKRYWVKGSELGRATLKLEAVPSAPKPNIKIDGDSVDGVTFFTPSVSAQVTSLTADFVPGGSRAAIASCTITDADGIATEAVIEVVDKDGGVVKELRKLTLPGDKAPTYDVSWDGKGSSGDFAYDKTPHKVRITVTDKFTRKTTGERPTTLIKPGSIVAAAVWGPKAISTGKNTGSLSGIKMKVVETGAEQPTAGDGTFEHKDLAPRSYNVEATLVDPLLGTHEIITPRVGAVVTSGAQIRAEVAVEPRTTIKVTLKAGGTAISGAKITLGGTATASKDTDGSGVADFGAQPHGPYTFDVSYVADSENDKKYAVPAQVSRTLARGDQHAEDLTTTEMPPLKVTVLCKKPDRKLDKAEVKITTSKGKELKLKSDTTGVVNFPHVPVEELKFDVSYEGQNLKDWEVPAQKTHTPTQAGPNELELEVEPKKCPVHIKLAFAMPDATEHLWPKDLEVKMRLDDDQLVEAKLDDKSILVEKKTGAVLKLPRIQKFSFEIPKTANKYLVIEKAGVTPATQEIIEDTAPKIGSTLGLLITAGKRAMLLPQEDLKLLQVDSTVAPADNYAAPQFDFKDKELIGTDTAPVKVLIKPKWQYVRFEFFDRRHGKASHAEKRISIPPVLLKASRKTASGSIGTVEVASSFTIEDADNAKACQALPWLAIKKPDGVAHAKLDKDLHLEWGQDDAWVEITSATERKIVKLDPTTDKAKIEPHKDRDKLYDLPALWKNNFYYTRLPGNTGKFFDELTDAEVEASYDKTKPLCFSLDDVVLVKGTDQDVKDKNKADGDIALSKHSRYAIIDLDPDDKYQVRIWDARPEAAYHTNGLFTKEAAGNVFRNHIAKLPISPRAVVFANGFYDIVGKRTTVADYAKKQILGARAAKLEDGEVSAKRKFDAGADVTKGYVHKTRKVIAYYLHYAGTDGTTVYDAAISYWTTRIFAKATQKPVGWNHNNAAGNSYGPVSGNDADKRNYHKDGMAFAMTRWNEKKYQLEEADDKTERVIKLFMLFEAKDIEDPVDTWNEVGGSDVCITGVGTDAKGSWANDKWMFMRRSGYKEEGKGWGSAPGTEVKPADYDGNPGRARCALVHELGHAAVGLWDDYVTQKAWTDVPTHKKEVQRYPGIPFNRDGASLMSPNQAVRLRMMQGRMKWINDEAKLGEALHPFLKAKKFQLTYAPAGKTKLKYTLDGPTSFYTPSHSETPKTWGEEAKADLHLYQMGSDEFTNLIKNGPYDGMLIVETRIEADFKRGFDAAKDWKDGTAFALGDVADYDAKFYICKTAHTAGADFATDAAKWQELNYDDADAWAVDTNVTKAKWLEDSGDEYVVLKDHKTGARTDKHWKELGPNKGAWATTAAYAQEETVSTGGKTYLCLSGHTAGATFAGDSAHWKELPVKGAFGAADYAIDDLVTEGGKRWRCTEAVKGKSLDADVEDGRILKPTCAREEWDAATIKDWIQNTNKGLIEMLEGSEGKFTFTCDAADAKFKKTYLRPFVQFHDATDGSAPGGDASHYKFKVNKGVTKGFAPAGEDVVASEGLDVKTIARYCYGMLSKTKATRASQDLTAEMTAADLTALKDWIEGKAGETRAASTLVPVIDSVAPGPGAAEGETVTIKGTNLDGTTKVTFGTVDQTTIASKTATQVTAVVPAGAVNGKVKLASPKGNAESKTVFKILPKITAVGPTAGAAVGDTVTIDGTTLAGATKVTFNTTDQATIASNTATQITAVVPAGATTGKVHVTVTAGTATSTADLKILPKVTAIAPTTPVAVGANVTITGTNLAAATAVEIGGKAATIVSNTATQIVATVAAGAASGSVKVTTADGDSTLGGFLLAP